MNQRTRRGQGTSLAIISVLLFSAAQVGATPVVVLPAHGFQTDPVEILSSQKTTKVFPCATNGSGCDLKNFSLQVDTYRVTFPGPEYSFGTRSIARYETQEVKQLENYGIAQFLRGCQYTSSLDQNGRVIKTEDVVIEIGGQNLPYRFARFITDGFVRDPLDWGDDPGQTNRHAYYRWNKIPGSVDPATSQWYGMNQPTNPALYVVDHPGTAFYSAASKSARNISVQFKTCLYKASDVPRDVDPGKTDFAKPLASFQWNSSFIYNFATGQMDSVDDLDPFCLQSEKARRKP